MFNLTVEELLGAVEGAGITGDLEALVRLRDAEHRAQMARPDPPERFSVRGAHISGVDGAGGAGGRAGRRRRDPQGARLLQGRRDGDRCA